jgi:hypothetical protein
MSSSSFTTKKLNPSTFLVIEDDSYGERPFIYVKVHPAVPVIIVGDTGCDRASKPQTHGKCTYHLIGLASYPIQKLKRYIKIIIPFQIPNNPSHSPLHPPPPIPRTISTLMQQQHPSKPSRRETLPHHHKPLSLRFADSQLPFHLPSNRPPRPHPWNHPIPPWRPNRHTRLRHRPRLHRIRPREERPL